MAYFLDASQLEQTYSSPPQVDSPASPPSQPHTGNTTSEESSGGDTIGGENIGESERGAISLRQYTGYEIIVHLLAVDVQPPHVAKAIEEVSEYSLTRTQA